MRTKITSYWNGIIGYAKAHKFISIIAIAVILFGGYYGYKKIFPTIVPTQYVLGAVEKTTIVSSVSATGQVSTSNQIDLKPAVSGEITYVGVKPGDAVTRGTVIARIDAGDASKAVRNAELSLKSAELSLQKILQPSDSLSLLQSQNALTDANQSKQKAIDDLKLAYDDAFSKIADTYVDFPTVGTGVSDIFYSSSHSPYFSDSNIQTHSGSIGLSDKYEAGQKFDDWKRSYEASLSDYKNLSHSTDPAVIEGFLAKTYSMTKALADALKDTSTAITYAQNSYGTSRPAEIRTDLSNIATYLNQITGHLSDLSSVQSSIKNAKDSQASADRSIAEKNDSLQKVKTGSDSLDIQSAQLSVTERQNALNDAEEALADYTIRAPFDGIIAKSDIKKGDMASSATIAATLITKKQVADVTLNEVDVSKIKAGQRATLTFDAVSGLTITGQVLQVDGLGTLTQGVVAYSAKIGFDTEDDRIKSGMNVSASIITDTKVDVLAVSNGAVKTANRTSYVQELDGAASGASVTTTASPRSVPVEIGSSNDSETEIISGLKEGEVIIIRTISGTGAKTSSAPTATSLLGGGASRAGSAGGAARGNFGR